MSVVRYRRRAAGGVGLLLQLQARVRWGKAEELVQVGRAREAGLLYCGMEQTPDGERCAIYMFQPLRSGKPGPQVTGRHGRRDAEVRSRFESKKVHVVSGAGFGDVAALFTCYGGVRSE